MAQETPQNVNPSTDPQVENPPSTAVSASAIDISPTPVPPATNPEVPAVNTQTQLPTAPEPDEAYLEAQTAQENRWIQAAATNPEGVQRDGSIKTVSDTGVATTVNRDGSYAIQNVDGTTYYDAAGQQTAYTTPPLNGFSVTTTADGVQYTNYTNGPLTTSTITNNGEPISTTVSYDFGLAQISQTTTGDQVVNTVAVPQGGGIVENYVVDDQGQILGQSTTDLAALREQGRAAYAADMAASEALVADALAAKKAAGSFQALDAEQAAQLEQAAQQAEQAAAELAQAEENLTDADPLYVSPAEDPQVPAAPTDDVALFDIEVAPPEGVSPYGEEDAPIELADNSEPTVAASPYGEEDAPIELADNSEPTVAASPYDTEEFADTLGDLIAEADSPTTDDPIVLAQVDAETATDVPVNDIVETNSTVTDFTFEDNASLGYSEPAPYIGDPGQTDPGFVPYSARPEETPYQTDTGEIPGVTVSDRTQTDTGFIDPAYGEFNDALINPQVDQPQDINDGISPYGEEDEIADPDYFGPDPALYTEEYVQEQDNPTDGFDYNTEDELSPYGEENDELDPVPLVDPFEVDGTDYGVDELEQAEDNPNIATLVEPDPYEIDGIGLGDTTGGQTDPGDGALASQQQATLAKARAQAALQAQRKQANDGDWRVKLRLAPGATYLYKAPQPGILQPLAVTDGVVFPYTPTIQTVYKANYSQYDLTHSNYRGYFYQGSAVEDITINATFTAQDSNEANYLLAVIHFFRSATKMFYGQGPNTGTPPPLVFLQGLGEYQFNLAPCVIASFNYNLPNDVDYIRAGSPNINGTSMLQRRSRQDLPTNPFSSAWSRINNVLNAQGISKGAVPGAVPPPPATLGTNRPTYVPTKMEIAITLHPIQSRSQVSKQFSLQGYASGDLLKGGFW